MTPDVVGVFVPIVAILGGVGLAIGRLVTNHRQRLQRAEFRHKERLAAIEKGLELPLDAPEGDPAVVVDASRFLRQGLVLAGIGAALTAGLMQMPVDGVPYLFGLIPAAIGLAYLLYYFIQRRHQARDSASASPGGPRTGAT